MHRPTPIDNERDRLDASRWAAVTLPSSVTPRVCDTAPEGPHIAAECVLSGCFLQTRSFLSSHPRDRLLPVACTIEDDEPPLPRPRLRYPDRPIGRCRE